MVLECDGIEFGYNGRPLLTSIYLRVQTGTVTALVGRNGCGKSTLMKVCFGALRPSAASVRIDGVPLPRPAFRSRRLVYLPQDTFLPVNMSVRSILKCYGLDYEHVFEDFPELKIHVDLLPGELSGGHLRLLEVLLILKKPGVHFCLLDEPFTGLSPVVVERLQTVINKEKATKGILISDHLFRQVQQLADNMVVLTNGRTAPVKSAEDLVHFGYLADHQ